MATKPGKMSDIMLEMAQVLLREPSRVPSSEAMYAALFFANVAWNECVGLHHPREGFRNVWETFEDENPSLWNELKSNDINAMIDKLVRYKQAHYPDDPEAHPCLWHPRGEDPCRVVCRPWGRCPIRGAAVWAGPVRRARASDPLAAGDPRDLPQPGDEASGGCCKAAWADVTFADSQGAADGRSSWRRRSRQSPRPNPRSSAKLSAGTRTSITGNDRVSGTHLGAK